LTPRLVAISGPCEGQTFEVLDSPFVLGRQSGCDLQLNNIEVSRRHCEIVRGEDGSFILRDLGSRHGTIVNGRRASETTLVHSDLVTLGTNALLFLLDDSASRHLSSEETDSMPALGLSLERKLTETLHLDPARVDAALPAQARLARELHTLLRMATALQEHRQVAPLAASLLDASLEAMPTAEKGAVLLQEPGLEQPISIAERGEGIPQINRAMLNQVLHKGLAICRPHVALDQGLDATGGTSEVGSMVAAPLVDSTGEPFGMIYLLQRSQEFAKHHLELLTAIAGVASLAFQNVLHLRWLESENRRLQDEVAVRHDMIGESSAMQAVFDLVARAARADSTILIQGESCTGKELVARAIHRTSPRHDGPFIAVNCATLQENLLESELFGHEKGSFTGALARKTGKVESAHRGTLFLDEVAEIPVGLQAKLLRTLQEREVERVGGNRPIPVDIRVVVATHRNLEQAVLDGAFREDLYFRLKVITCKLPPLRERREDIPLLARYFARHHGEKLGVAEVGIAPEARRCLLAYNWPGNVRELGNVIERAVVLGDGEVVRREDLPDEVVAAALGRETAGAPAEDTTNNFQSRLMAFKKQLILDAWHTSGEDYARTAKTLEIHVNSLHRLVKSLALKNDLGR
jgi:Nif-specific regulatory protein